MLHPYNAASGPLRSPAKHPTPSNVMVAFTYLAMDSRAWRFPINANKRCGVPSKFSGQSSVGSEWEFRHGEELEEGSSASRPYCKIMVGSVVNDIVRRRRVGFKCVLSFLSDKMCYTECETVW